VAESPQTSRAIIGKTVSETQSNEGKPNMKNPNTIFTPIVLVCFGFLPRAQAVVPAPDGGYPGGNTAEGQGALFSLTTGTNNTAVGWFSLKSVTTGQSNTAIGAGALSSSATSNLNTATGVAALFSNTTGHDNTANGALSLFHNTTGFFNTAVGTSALFDNTRGGANTAVGTEALGSNTTGGANTAVGHLALHENTTGDANTAIGRSTLYNNTVGSSNTAIGQEALLANSAGTGQTAIGYQALRLSTASGQFCFGNTAVGSLALDDTTDGCSNTAIGSAALGSNTTGSGNVAVGLLAGGSVTTANNVICIGTTVQGANEDNGCYIGNIYGQHALFGTQVFVTAAHKLGTIGSSKRFKEGIRPTEQASEALFALKPVTFRYKKEIDPKGTSQFGLVAEDVEKVNPDLVVRDKEGKPYSVRYDQVNAMLLNEFLKEHRIVQEQNAMIAELKSTVEQQEATNAQQQKQIQTLTAGLQKVSAQIQMSKGAPRIARNGH
jgi:hypothetical protein